MRLETAPPRHHPPNQAPVTPKKGEHLAHLVPAHTRPRSPFQTLLHRINPLRTDKDREAFLKLLSTHDPCMLKSKEVYHALRFCNKLAKRGLVSDELRIYVIEAVVHLTQHMSEKQFDPHRALKNRIPLQRLLCPRLDLIMELADKDPSIVSTEQYRLDLAVAQAELSSMLGYGITAASSGQHGALIVRSVENKPIGVFKPTEPLEWHNFIRWTKRFVGQSRLLDDKLDAREVAEEAAYQLDRAFGFQVVPSAEMARLSGTGGAFIAFLHDYQPASEVREIIQAREHFTQSELEEAQKAFLFDFLCGNLDCHDENLFIRLKGGHIQSIRVIDHGNCFPKENRGRIGYRGHQYEWQEFAIASFPFTDRMRTFVANMQRHDLEQFINRYRDRFLSEPMQRLLIERFTVLTQHVASGRIATPRDLAQIQTDADFNAYLS